MHLIHPFPDRLDEIVRVHRKEIDMDSSIAIKPVSPAWSEETADQGFRRIRARIGGLHCSLCTGTIEKALGKTPGVRKVAVSLTHEQALIEYDPSVRSAVDIMKILTDIGYTLSDPRKLRKFDEEEALLQKERGHFLTALVLSVASMGLVGYPVDSVWFPLCVFSLASLVVFSFVVLRGYGTFPALTGATLLGAFGGGLYFFQLRGTLGGSVVYLSGGLAVYLVFGVGFHIFRMASRALFRGILNQHVLVEFGAFAGLAGGATGMAAHLSRHSTVAFFSVTVMVLTYHLFSEWLSLVVKTRSSQAVKKLLDLEPDRAHVMRNGQEETVALEKVQVGDQVRVRSGERIPVDGTVESGESHVDESLVNGESIPARKRKGDRMLSGSLNGRGTLLIRVTAVGDDSFLRQVIRSVEDARALKPGILHLVDRVLRVYTPAVLLTSAAAVIGWLVFPEIAGRTPDLERALFAGLGVLVMGYPCAVGISAPLSIVRGAGEAAERGILMRTGEAFQSLRRVTHVVFDKTGTLTDGHFALQEAIPVGSPEEEISKEELLALAASAEAGSGHPIAQTVLKEAFARNLSISTAQDFEELPGKGVKARQDNRELVVGNPGFLESRGIDLSPVCDRIPELESQGKTVIGVGHENRLVGLLTFGDRLRPDAAETVQRLHRLGIRTSLVTGDNEQAAGLFARAAGISEVHAKVLPGGKAEWIRQWQEKGPVAMVGDGINDAPALMQADVGIAFGNAADIATESADVIVLNHRLEAILDACDISRRSYRKIVQNVTIALFFNGIGIPVAATGLINPVWAMVAMAASVTAIFLNSLWGRGTYFFDALKSVGTPASPLVGKRV